MALKKDKVYEEVNNYTKYKLVEMFIDNYKDKKIDNLNMIEQMSDDVLRILAMAGMKFYRELKGEFDEGK